MCVYMCMFVCVCVCVCLYICVCVCVRKGIDYTFRQEDTDRQSHENRRWGIYFTWGLI